jgi:CubicO group peptidase (beta-lactamase class C family)
MSKSALLQQNQKEFEFIDDQGYISSIEPYDKGRLHANRSDLLESLGDTLLSGMEKGFFKGAAVLVSVGGEIIFFDSIGTKNIDNIKSPTASEQNSPRFSKELVFDVNELTAPLVLNSLLALLISSEQLVLSDRVSRFLPSFCLENKENVTIEQLLNHTSGINPNLDLFDLITNANSSKHIGILNCSASKHFLIDKISQAPLKFAPSSDYFFSNSNNIILGHIIENLTGMNLDHALNRFILKPLGMTSSGYIDQNLLKNEAALPVMEMFSPSAYCSIRNKLICGEAFDLTAWGMGGISGHSGFFSSLKDLHNILIHFLLSYHGEESIFEPNALSELMKFRTKTSGKNLIANWGRKQSLNGFETSDDSFGLISPQGVSTWLDPHFNSVVILGFSRFDGNKNSQISRSYINEIILKATELVYVS